VSERRQLLGVISRGRTCEIRIERLVYKKRKVLDVRKFVAYAGGALCPTTIGVRFYFEQGEVSALVEALSKAQGEW
jgi:hypothetical protein